MPIFSKRSSDNTICIISLYVDDLLIAGSKIEIINKVKKEMNERYEMKDLGRVHHILGCEANHDEDTGTTYLSQYQHTKKAISRFFPEGLKPIDNPYDI